MRHIRGITTARAELAASVTPSVLALPAATWVETPAPAPAAAPVACDPVLEHHVQAPAPSTRPSAPERAPLPDVVRAWPVASSPSEGVTTIEIVQRGTRRRMALAWTRQRRTVIEVSPGHLAKLVEGITRAAAELGVELSGAPPPPPDDTRDTIYDRCAAGHELVRGRWVAPARPHRGRT